MRFTTPNLSIDARRRFQELTSEEKAELERLLAPFADKKDIRFEFSKHPPTPHIYIFGCSNLLPSEVFAKVTAILGEADQHIYNTYKWDEDWKEELENMLMANFAQESVEYGASELASVADDNPDYEEKVLRIFDTGIQAAQQQNPDMVAIMGQLGHFETYQAMLDWLTKSNLEFQKQLAAYKSSSDN